MKSKIFTITPNPALDISGVVDRVKVDEKTYVHDEIRTPGGNAINAARILHSLGIPVIASGFLGGSVGDEVEGLLKAEGLKHHFVRIKGSTRVNVTVTSRENNRQTRLSFAGPEIAMREIKSLMRLVRLHQENKIIVIGGSLPPQFRVQNLIQIMKVARKDKVPVIVDCPGSVLKLLIPLEPLLIKPNLDEFQSLTGSKVKSLSEVKERAQKLLKEVSFVCVSSVEGGALMVSRSGCYFGRIPNVKIRSAVGAGDSMVGAICAQFYHGHFLPDEILRWGLAAAAATLNESGAKLGRASRIMSLYKKTVVEGV